MDDSSSNLSKCSKCNDAPGDFILDSCLHNLCNYCVATCLEMRDIYNCPKCSTKSKISANLYLSILNRQSVEKCSWCEVRNEENNATGYCSECDIHLCPECIRGHYRMPQFRSHHVQLKTEADGQTFRNCDSHPNEALEIFCQTCEKLTCRDCQLSLHKEHKHQWIGEKAREMESSLSELREKMSSKINEIHEYSSIVETNREKLLENIQCARSDLKNYVEEFKKCQENYFDQLESELDQESQSREQKLVEVGKEVSRSLDIMQHCSQLLSKISSSREPSLLIQVTPKFVQSIQTILDRLNSEHNGFQTFLDLEYADSRFDCKKKPSEVMNEICEVKFGSNRQHDELEVKEEVEHSIYDDLIDDSNQWPIKRELCSVCNDGGFVVCCNGCGSLYHQACHVPRLAQMPAGSDWLCTACNHPRRFMLELADRSLPHKGRLNKKERKIVASIFLELLQYHDWTIFLCEETAPTGATAFKFSGNKLDLDKIRFNIENKIYTSIERFVEDLKEVFRQTTDRYKSTSVRYRVTKFQERLDFLLQKYINFNISK